MENDFRQLGVREDPSHAPHVIAIRVVLGKFRDSVITTTKRNTVTEELKNLHVLMEL
jgi:hypothetical protein